MKFGGGKGCGVFFLLNNFSRSFEVIWGSNKIRKAYLDEIWPILMKFGGRKGGGVFFLLNKFSRSFGVIWGSNTIRKAYLDEIWWKEGGWCVLKF